MTRYESTKKTDITTGRIVQRVLDAMSKGSAAEVVITHGVDWSQNIWRLINSLCDYFPNSEITLKKLAFGWEVKTKVVL